MSDFARRIPFPRPSSANKKRSFQLFSPAVSCSRLRRVQSLLKCSNNPQARISGILCILGIDSRYNGGARCLLNYLLCGFCDLAPTDFSNGTSISDEELEDIVAFVKAESVHIYCNPVNYPLLLPLIAHWRNLRIHCLSKDEYKNDEEKAEEFKITSFVSMVEGQDCIGIPFRDGGARGKSPSFDPLVLEKWPLVQAYALEGFGSGGFFTMNHEVLDISDHLESLYGLLDPVGVEILVTQTLSLFECHCKSVLTIVDIESSDDQHKLTERSLSEPLVSYFNHGHISDTENGKSSCASCQPFVLLGSNTSRRQLKNLGKCAAYNNNTTLANSGIDGSHTIHMVCFAVEPKGTITCARTYFLENGFVPLSLEAGKDSPYVVCRDLRLLMDLYLLSITAVSEGVKTYSQTLSKQQSLSTILAQLRCGIKENQTEYDPSLLSSKVEFTFEACDFLGRNVSLQDNQPLHVVKKICLYIYDVPSVEHPGKTLGSVVFGESFLDSTVKTLVPDASSVWNSTFVFLTQNIPRFVSWPGSGHEKQVVTEMNSFAKSKQENDLLGSKLLHGNEVYILSAVDGWQEGSLFIYARGFLFIHPRLGGILLPLNRLPKIQFYDEGSTSVTALLMLTYHSALQRNLPSYLTSENNSIVLALTPRSRIYRQFYSDVLHLWKGNQLPAMPPFEVITDLPEHLSTLHLDLQQQLQQSLSGGVQSLSSAEAFLPSLKSFLPHFSVSSSLGDKPVKAEDLPVLLGSNRTEQTQEKEFEMLCTILTGVPESGKDSLCLALVALAKENSKWVIIKRPINQADSFDPKELQNSLRNVLNRHRRPNPRMLVANKGRLRVIVVTAGFTDLLDVVQAISTHPDPEVVKCIKIGAVTCCVDPRNAYMENRMTLPKLLDQCAQGWVNNVVFTSSVEPQNEQLSLTQKLIRASNPDVAFILAKGGEVTRTPDVELILSDRAFNEDRMVQKRHLMCPGWSLGLFSSGAAEPPVSEISISFYGPLDKARFVANLKALQGPITGKEMKSGAIHSLQGHICFSEEGTHKEVHFHWARLTGGLGMTAVDSSVIPRPPSSKAQSNGALLENIQQYFIVFTGFSLQEQNLKNWLTTCCKLAPVKQKLKVRNDLSEKEISNICTKHKFDPLPPGWFYNGSHYVSLTGEKDSNHPLLATFIESYLQEVNEDIKRHNMKVDSQKAVVRDMFEKPTGNP